MKRITFQALKVEFDVVVDEQHGTLLIGWLTHLSGGVLLKLPSYHTIAFGTHLQKFGTTGLPELAQTLAQYSPGGISLRMVAIMLGLLGTYGEIKPKTAAAVMTAYLLDDEPAFLAIFNP